MRSLVAQLRNIDSILILSVCGIFLFGFLAILGSEFVRDEGHPVSVQHLVYFVTGFFLMLVTLMFDYTLYRKFWLWVVSASVMLLVGVLLFGVTLRGTQGWLGFGNILVQPVEFVKPLFVIFLAHIWTRTAPRGYTRPIIFSLFGLGIITILIMLQPDFGSAILFVLLWLVSLFFIGLRWWRLVILIGTLLCIAAGSMYAAWDYLAPYQQERIQVFLGDIDDPLGSEYNIIQATTAIGSGGATGKGLGHGTQTRLQFLPESRTDFLFAAFAEELGFVGSMGLLSMFGLLFWRALRIAMHTRDRFGFYLVILSILLIFIQFFVNIGVNLRLMPVTGLTMPFFSAGGSSMWGNWMLIGLILSVGAYSKKRGLHDRIALVGDDIMFAVK
jgi:cell division protein FtsW (lipid II flippase)